MDFEQFFRDSIAGLKAEGRYRVFADLERCAGAFPKALHHPPDKSGPGPRKASGEAPREAPGEVIVWCSNDYLGLASHLDSVAALQEAAAWHGIGSGGSHLVCGHHREHQQLEEELADWLGYPRALVFGSGYLANLGALQGLLRSGDLCVQDKLNHACLLDGARLAGCELKRYPHLDVEGAMRQLASRRDAPAMLATDGVFSMDGDLAPLSDLALLARSERALLYVDDAHGVGVIGSDGRGSVAQCGLGAREVPLLLVTFGMAIFAPVIMEFLQAAAVSLHNPTAYVRAVLAAGGGAP